MSKTVKFKYEQGIKIRDKLSGMEGVINARSEFINGCIRYCIQPRCKADDTSKIPDNFWIDEQQIEIIDDGVKKEFKPIRTGGPSEKAPRF